MNSLLKNQLVIRALEYIKDDDCRTLDEQLELCAIPGPTFHEEVRALWVKTRFEEIGLAGVHLDEVNNVIGKIEGTGGGPIVCIAAHIDTVFPEGTDLTVKTDGERYICPGINDDTRGVAELFTIARAMIRTGISAMGDIIFCADVCEEGLGDLKGIRHLFRNNPKIDAFISIDHSVPGGILYKATGSLRYKVIFKGKGGHSFSDFGIPNPVHALGRAVSEIASIKVPEKPKTTFNVGIIEGGTSVNSIAKTASMLVDLRSDSSPELEKLYGKFIEALISSVDEENAGCKTEAKIVYEIQEIGSRPSGTQPDDAVIVQTAREAALLAGLKPVLCEAGSTDANIPVSMGIPAVVVGRGGREGGIHTVDEWFIPEEAYRAPQRTLLLLLGLSGYNELFKPRLTVK